MLGLADNHFQIGKERLWQRQEASRRNRKQRSQTKLAIPLDKAGRSTYPKKLNISLDLSNLTNNIACQGVPAKSQASQRSLSGIPEAPASADEVAVHTRVSRDRPPGLTWLQLLNRHAFAKRRRVMEGSTIQAASD
jgi:hypothetical protein